MPFNGNGVFSLIYNWITDAANGVDIEAARMQPQDQDIADGLSNCITRDGQSPPVANIPMGNFKLTGLANGSQPQDSATFGQISGFAPVASPTFTGTVTAPVFAATANNTGQNYKVGDDAWIGDANITNGFKISGQADPAAGFVTFGTSGALLGCNAGDPTLRYGGSQVWNSSTLNPSNYALVTGQAFTGDITRTGNNGGSSFGLGLLGGNAMLELNGIATGIYYDNSSGRIKFRIGGTDVASIDGSGNVRALGNFYGAQTSV